MRLLRRVLLAVYSVLFVAACVGLAVLAWNQDRQLDISPDDFRFVAFISADDPAKWLFTLLMAALALFGLLTFIAALTPDRARGSRGKLRMRQAEGGTVEVTSGAIEGMLRDELERLPEIRQADPHVRLGRGGSVDTDVSAVIEPSASIAHVTNLVAVTTASTLREQVGVTNVRRPNVRIEYDEVSARPVAVRGPSGGRRGKAQSAASEPWPEPPANLHDRPETPQQPAEESWPEPPAELRREPNASNNGDTPPPAASSEEAAPTTSEGAQESRD